MAPSENSKFRIIPSHHAWEESDTMHLAFDPESSASDSKRSESAPVALRYVRDRRAADALEVELQARRISGGGRRAGGGGRGGGSSGGRGGTSSSGSSGGVSSSSGGSSGSTRGFTPGTVTGGSSVYGSPSANGIRTPYTVTSGPFVGRTVGGGTRSNIYGSRSYGSGYPAVAGVAAGAGLYAGASVASRGFPFGFYPLWYPAYPYWSGSYILRNDTDRPGGAMTLYALAPPAGVDAAANTFALYGDYNSVDDVFGALIDSCNVSESLAANNSALAVPNATVQYYRGSSFALTLLGYNNGLPNATDDSANITQSPTALPSGVNSTYLNCLNTTIGSSMPLLQDNSGNSAVHFSPQAMLLLPLLVAVVSLLQSAL